MFAAWCVSVAVQCALLFFVYRQGRAALLGGTTELPYPPLGPDAPKVGVIIPVAGQRAGMEAALRSLLEQDYPCYEVVFVTAEEDDPAVPCLRTLTAECAHARHVTAGRASRCGQKNHNSLCGIAALGRDADIYAFCDSTHTAPRDFLRTLVWPVAAGETAFSTGYHAVDALDDQPVSLGYQITVIFMRLLQAVSVFTQPWGGAMAIARPAFERYGIEELWATNVVDDCSLAGLLMARRGHMRLCPSALLRTPVAAHASEQWLAWFDRQILFLKFCTPAMWYVMGAGLALLFAPTLCSLALLACWPLFGFVPAWSVAVAAAHLMFLLYFALALRDFSARRAPAPAWLRAFALNYWLLGRVYVRSITCRHLRWHDTTYHVGAGGRVISLDKHIKHV
ncbi:MAG: glycosyltransferase [Deltaproteobacteria bacterium]|jgi:cellulose synthase/poly-beta-1,6-N-acetylglucosamine synthase-like glycosyltransferase|nr:glycosyltransferase [Deltaproteobacteria bacterium]